MNTNITMKLWELDSILNWAFNIYNGKHREVPIEVAGIKPEWEYLASWFNELDAYIIAGRRDLLDSHIPVDFVCSVLNKVNKYCYLSKKDGHLRSYKFKSDDEPLSYLECFNRYGGTILEDTLEKGSYKVNAIPFGQRE